MAHIAKWGDLTVPVDKISDLHASLTKEERASRIQYICWLRDTPMDQWAFHERIHEGTARKFWYWDLRKWKDLKTFATDKQWEAYLRCETFILDLRAMKQQQVGGQSESQAEDSQVPVLNNLPVEESSPELEESPMSEHMYESDTASTCTLTGDLEPIP